MNASELERIRQKVEAGEPLTSAELDRLRDAAQAQPGPTLRLAVAHALINGGQERAALPLLERLVRDFPRDLQVWLGHARALMALERRPEAEHALKQALALSPDDAEALKALALIALQRGELARAKQVVGDVLRRDPFDSEAQLIKAELDAPGELPPPSPASGTGVNLALRPEFIRALLQALRARGIHAQRQEDALLMKRPSGDVARVDVKSLYSAYLSEQRPLREAVRHLADGLVAAVLGLPEEKSALLERVLPVLRPASFAEVAPGAAHRAGPAGLSIFYAIDDPELVRYVPQGSIEARGISIEELDAAAFALLEKRPAPVRRVGVLNGELTLPTSPARVFAVCAEDGHDGARLLTRAQREVLTREVGPGPWRVSLGLREAALLCRDGDPVGAGIVRSLRAAPDGIAGELVLTADGVLDVAR